MRITQLATATALLAACGSDPEPGTIEARVYGEEYIEDAIPSTVFSDGWTLTFDRFLVSIGGITTQAGHDADELRADGFTVFDLSQPSPEGAGYLVATIAAPGGTYDHFGYVLKPDATAIAGNASSEDVVLLKAGGESVRVTGTATKGSETVTFDWGFPLTVVLSHCDVEDEVDGDTVAIQATIHGDHLFYDDLVSTEPNVSFDLVAAADGADGTPPDGDVTQAELAAKNITGETRYQVGSFEVEDLWAFISHQVGTVGHINGEGHCEDVTVSGG